MKTDKQLHGLQRICKLYGRMKCGDTMMVWDYAGDVAVPESEMKPGSKRWCASERIKWEVIRNGKLYEECKSVIDATATLWWDSFMTTNKSCNSKETMYRTAKALVSCAAFKAGEYVSVDFFHFDNKGAAWYLIRRAEKAGQLERPVAYPANHLTQFCL